MRKQSPITYVLVAAVIFAAAMIVMNIYAVRAQKPEAQSNAKDEDQKVKEALRRGGYREAARIKGHYVGNTNPNWDWSQFDIEALTKNSVAIIVGITQR